MKQKVVSRLREYRGVCRTAEGMRLAFEGLVATDAQDLLEKYQLSQRLERLQRERNLIEKALSCLDPIQRRVVELLDVTPKKGNCARLCEELGREPATVYRWRDKALEKVGQVLFYDSIPQK